MTDQRDREDLPEAFQAETPPANDSDQQFGAGHLVESAVPEETRNARRKSNRLADEQDVEEASEESFPGSDAPSFNADPTD